MSVPTDIRKLVQLGTVTTASTQKSDPLVQPNIPYIGYLKAKIFLTRVIRS